MFYPLSARGTVPIFVSAGLGACFVAFCLNAWLLYLGMSAAGGDVRKLVPDLFHWDRSKAASLSTNGETLQGALLGELEGDSAKAEKLLLEAANGDKGFLPRFALAGFYYRQKDRDGFAKWARAALESSDEGAQAILAMASQLGLRNDALFKILPDRPAAVSLALQRAIAQFSIDEVLAFSTQLLRAGGPQDADVLLSACEALVWLGRTPDAVGRWNASLQRGWVKSDLLAPEDGKSLTDGSFAPEAPGRGFGWRINSPELGQRDPRSFVHRARGLSIGLSGAQAENVSIVAQYLAVEPGRRYLATVSYDQVPATVPGVFWRVVDLKGRKDIAHSTDLESSRKSAVIVFDVPRDSQAVELALWATRRTGSSRPSGTFTVGRVDLVRLVSQ